jgi:hypothetical protein
MSRCLYLENGAALERRRFRLPPNDPHSRRLDNV